MAMGRDVTKGNAEGTMGGVGERTRECVLETAETGGIWTERNQSQSQVRECDVSDDVCGGGGRRFVRIRLVGSMMT